MQKIILCAFAALLINLSHTAYAEQSRLIIDKPWIAEAPPVSKVMVAYLTIKNPGNAAIEITRAESNSYSSIEFHETDYADGMARMLRHDSLTIPANGELQLKRGGQHLMLFNPTKHFKAGEEIEVTFTLKDGSNYTIKVPVKKAQF